MIALAVIAVVVAVLVVAAFFKGSRSGKDSAEVDAYERRDQENIAAKRARDRLLSDNEYGKQLRDKYTRK